MASVILFRHAQTAPRATRLSAAVRAIVARLAAAYRGPAARRELCGLPEWQLRDIALSRSDAGRLADARLAVLQESDRSGTSLFYVPRP